MPTLPDFKEKRVLLVLCRDKEDLSLKLRSSNIVFYKNEELINKLSLHSAFSVFIIGETTITTKLLSECLKHGISLFFLNRSLKCYGAINARAEGNYLLRQKQYTLSKNVELTLAKSIVANKINNQTKLLYKLNDKYLPKTSTNLQQVKNTQDLLGMEGIFAKEYFKNIFGGYGWYRRAPQTKEDINNLLLDMGYTFAFNFVDALLCLFGFDTYKGFYHQLFFQRKSLTCDIVEPLRPLIDHELIKARNLKIVNEKDFRFSNGEFSFKKYENSKKYANLWLNMLMKNNEEIYKYILGFYRHLQNPEVYEFIEFTCI